MTVSLPPDVSVTEVDDGLVLLDQRDGGYYQLNRTGAASLRLLLDGHSPAEVARTLAERHPAAAERALGDVQQLLAALREARLVVTA
ncbi:lasso peptide biosynthesis PqqD family chaperone [Amycolatopsis magusensis]|uniref:Coenzyme PQQ synthesis protein D (PqqD) n=1 Tax=Amycolatopsis magusensis TaxID=882444 RepID=A0ABS4PQP9_9PSEU|nr:lasso peptide biosynthesis PqqD family chaperone [Amycolatopsis magusensis]MBP2181758.1 hypothetical protein [Amycolatopsis magusensis]